MPYDKGDFTQQGINGDVSALVRLNEKRVMKVVLSSDDESDNCDISGKVYDLLNGTSYDIGSGGGGGGGLDLLKLSVTIVNSPESIISIDQDTTNIFTMGYEVHDKMLSLTSDYPAEYTLNPGESATIELLYDYNSAEHAYVGFPIAHTTATNINNLTLDSSVPDTSFYSVTDATLDSSITLTYTKDIA